MTNDCLSGETLYREYHPKVSAYVNSRIPNRHDAEELVSAVFLKVFQKLDSFNPARASLSTWIYTITRNTVTDHFRTRHSLTAFADYMDYEDFPSKDADEALEQLADALLSLKEKERDLIVLHYYQGHTLKETAEMMGMSYINAKVIHKKALTGLRAFYAAG